MDKKKIKSTKEGEEKRFARYVEIVQRSYCDLSYMKVEHELSNTTAISLLKEKLPKDIRREWLKRVTELDSKMNEVNRSSEFLTFPLNQKQIIEYESAEIRMGMLDISRQRHHVQEGDRDCSNEDTAGNRRPPRYLVLNSKTRATTNCRAYMEKTSTLKLEIIKGKTAC